MYYEETKVRKFKSGLSAILDNGILRHENGGKEVQTVIVCEEM